MRTLAFVGLAFTASAAFAQGAGIAPGGGVMPGQWDIAVTTLSMEMPDMPPEVAASMAGKTVHVKHCITPEEASRGPQELLKQDKSCKFTNYSMVGGRLNSTTVCGQPGGGTMTATSSGTFTPTRFTTTGKSVMVGRMTMKITATTVGTRIGACTK